MKRKEMAEERSLDARAVFPLIRLTKMTEKTLTEGEILEAVIAGDKEAYQAIVHRYMKSAYYIALGIVHNHQDALDISQESFIRAFRVGKKSLLRKTKCLKMTLKTAR
jgi:ABC-type iron transport system FetAB ATPase subunit